MNGGVRTFAMIEDGPAKGQTFVIQRKPIMLRVTQDSRTGQFDALDQTHDEPRATERIWVYRLVPDPKPGAIHIDRRDPVTGNRSSGWYFPARYRVEPAMPPETILRGNLEWRIWATAAAKRKPATP